VAISVAEYPHVVVGAPLDDGPGNSTDGMGAVYRWANSAGTWVRDLTTYRLDDGETMDLFGLSVGVSGSDFFGASSQHTNPDLSTGVVRVFGASATLIQAPPETQERFGESISALGERLAIHGPNTLVPGHAYLYERRGDQWLQLVTFDLTPHDGGGLRTISVGSDALFIGDHFNDLGGENCGAVFAYGPLGDCNVNDWIDVCEIATGAATDCNLTGTPDECELIADGDFDADGDVDNDDFAAFADGMAGPDVPPDPDDPTCVDVYLAAFDTEPDDDLDLHDFAAFQRAFSGPLLVPPPGMALVPAGEFEMGDPFDEGFDDELPLHTVHLSAYFIDGYEVTNAQYAAALNWAWAQGGLIEVTGGGVVKKAGDTEEYCDTTTSSSYSRIEWDGSTFTVPAGKEDHPMVEVSWYGAVAFSNWRSVMAGRTPCYDLATWTCDFDASGFRLPTEAEWEKAAGWDPDLERHFRFGEHTDGCGENCLDGQRANYGGSGDPFETGPFPWTTPVGYYAGSDHGGYQTQDAQSYYGCRDMSGNVWEWCHDWYDSEYYDSSPYGNPTGPDSGTSRVLRGGDWHNAPYLCRSSFRYRYSPDLRNYHVGFRCALGTP
jgi:formylglycine-generating enzyme required for sulfatase activity